MVLPPCCRRAIARHYEFDAVQDLAIDTNLPQWTQYPLGQAGKEEEQHEEIAQAS
jgi:hypothetical protein